MHVRPRFVAAFAAATLLSLLSLLSIAPALAVSHSSGLTIRITRPSAATVNLGADLLGTNALTGSLTPADSRGSAWLCPPSDVLDVLPAAGCVPLSGGAAVAFTLPLEPFAGYDVVATAS